MECLSLTDIQLVACADEDMDRRRLHACMHALMHHTACTHASPLCLRQPKWERGRVQVNPSGVYYVVCR